MAQVQKHMVDWGYPEANEKFRAGFKGDSVFKPVKKWFGMGTVDGYTNVHSSYLVQELDTMKRVSKLGPQGESCQMLDHLLTFMNMRKAPWYTHLLDMLHIGGSRHSTDYKGWIALRSDHWIMDQKVRSEMLKRGEI